MKKSISLFLMIFMILILCGCTPQCEHEWSDPTCDSPSICKLCGEISGEALGHDYKVKKYDPDCTHPGNEITTCYNCDYYNSVILEPLGHDFSEYVPEVSATCEADGTIGYYYCSRCKKYFNSDKQEVTSLVIEATGHKYVKGACRYCGKKDVNYNPLLEKNGYETHGKLSVKGADLIDKRGRKFQLIGLSTHGLQWAGDFVNYDTFKNIRDSFGINVIRLSLYPDEGGYCECSPEFKETLYQRVVKGIQYATELDMYVILDWHMLGAANPKDGDPNYYREEAKAYF